MNASRLPAKAALFSLLALAACGSETQTVDLTAPAFDREPLIKLNVADVKVIDEYQPTFGGNNVEQLFATSPARAVGIWTSDRLNAAGSAGVAEVHILNASVTETHDKDYDRYDGDLSVDIKLYDGTQSFAVAQAHAESKLTRNIKKGDNVTKREDLFAQMTRDLSASLDQSLDQQIRQNFGRYIVAVQPR